MTSPNKASFDDLALRTSARQVSLLRLLLLAIAVGTLVHFSHDRDRAQLEPAVKSIEYLLVGIGALSFILILCVGWVRWQWQLLMHLVFDLAWTGMLVFLSGGVASSGVVLLFAVILIGALILPGMLPFILPALASLTLAGISLLYLAGQSPFSPELLRSDPSLTDANRMLSALAMQIAALFLVDGLGQLLARRLNEQRIFTGELLDQLGEGVLAIDRIGIVAYVNAEATRLLEIDQDQVKNRLVDRVLSRADLQPALLLLRADQAPSMERMTGPKSRNLVLRCTQIVGRGGKPIGRILLIADETRLQVLEDSARRSEHLSALGEMAAGIAHEVRNPLTSLRGCAQELSEMMRKDGQADAADLAAIMVGEADRLARIVDEFLALSRMRTPNRESVKLAELFEELNTLYAKQRDLPNLKLEFGADDECPRAYADEGQVRQIITNLVNNAIDAVRRVAHPIITVHARAAPHDDALPRDFVEITVADNGCGIAPELQERIFTPFFSTKSKGTGLGLSLVQRIVREHEGVLQLKSQPGGGTHVTVLLPVHSQTRIFQRALGGRG